VKLLFENWRNFLGEAVGDPVQVPEEKLEDDYDVEQFSPEPPPTQAPSRKPPEESLAPGTTALKTKTGETYAYVPSEEWQARAQKPELPDPENEKFVKYISRVPSSGMGDSPPGWTEPDYGPKERYAVDVEGREHFPEGRFKHVRDMWEKAYTSGANREVWIDVLKKNYADKVKRGELSRWGKSPPDRFFEEQYEKTILPAALKAIQSTPVSLMRKGEKGHSNYRDQAGLVGDIRKARPYMGLSADSKRGAITMDRDVRGQRESDEVFSHELGHAIDDQLGSTTQPISNYLLKDLKPTHTGLSGWQREKLKEIFPMLGQKSKAARAAVKDPFNPYGQGSEGALHSFSPPEIWSNIAMMRAQMGRRFTAEDITRLRNQPYQRHKGGKFQEHDPQPPGHPQAVGFYGESDLASLLAILHRQRMSDEEIASKLNMVASTDAPEGSGEKEEIDTGAPAPEIRVPREDVVAEFKRSKGMKPLFENWRKHLKERESLEEDLEDFDRTTLEAKLGLNPELWRDQRINPHIRDTLLQIATDFFNGLGLEGVDVRDVVVTGSLANYNWSKYSDIDLHIIVDFKQVDENVELVRNFFNAKKSVWNRTHDIKIKGYEVEVYVEDPDDIHYSSGVYSLLRDNWLFLPARQDFDLDWENITIKAEAIMSEIDELEQLHNLGRYEEVLKYSEKIKSKIKRLRQSGLETGGEYSIENLVFKVLRRTDYIGRLLRLKVNAYDRSLSIDGEQ